jgi:hypothetical protein
VSVLERHALPTRSPVVALAESSELLAAATFDDGAFVLEPGGSWQPVVGVEAVNALAFDEAATLYVASDDGAFVVAPGERARRIARGAFSAVMAEGGEVWFASRAGVHRLDGEHLTTWGPSHGVQADQPTSIARCGASVCVGAANGMWEVSKGSVRRRSTADGALPAELVTAVAASGSGTWVGTFDGGLVQLGQPPLSAADGLADGRIQPRALSVVGDVAVAGTPSGLLLAHGRDYALVSVGGAVWAAMSSSQRGAWIGMAGEVLRVEVPDRIDRPNKRGAPESPFALVTEASP